jgi:hypothetical protein
VGGNANILIIDSAAWHYSQVFRNFEICPHWDELIQNGMEIFVKSLPNATPCLNQRALYYRHFWGSKVTHSGFGGH